MILFLLEIYLPNTTVWTYGSRVRWSARPSSDLDMVVFSAPEQSSQVYKLRDAFDESNLPFRVDLFVWNEISDQFRKNIGPDYVVLFEDKEQIIPSGWLEVALEDVAKEITVGFVGSPRSTSMQEFRFCAQKM